MFVFVTSVQKWRSKTRALRSTISNKTLARIKVATFWKADIVSADVNWKTCYCLRSEMQDRWYQRQTFFEKVVFHPDLLERRAVTNKSRDVQIFVSAGIILPPVGFDVWANQFGSVASSVQSGKFRFCFLWRQVQAGQASEATSGKGCSSLLVSQTHFSIVLRLRRSRSQTLERFQQENWLQCEVAAGCRLKEHADCFRAKLL